VIPYIQPIFVPDEEHLEQNIDSIYSFGEYIKKYPFDILCAFGGYAKRDKWWTMISDVIEKNIPPDRILPIKKYNMNVGKGVVVNHLYTLLKEYDFDFFLTADSDIKFTLDTPHLFERLGNIGKNFKKDTSQSLGFVSLQQSGHCYHDIKKMTEQYFVSGDDDKKEKLVYSQTPGGIAGGCLFLCKAAWESVGGYQTKSVYGGHDGVLLGSMRSKKYACVISPDISIFHPRVKNQEYHELKSKLRKMFVNKKSKQQLKKVVDDFWDSQNE
jgi:hypothetical protein